MVQMQPTPKPLKVAWPPPAPEKVTKNIKSFSLKVSESASFHDAVDVNDLRDDVRAEQRGSATESDDTRDEAEEPKSSFEIPEFKPTESEEFEDVLAELAATESSDRSMEELLGSSSSETMVVKDDESLKVEADAAVKKLIDTVKNDREPVAKLDVPCVPADDLDEIIDSVKNEIAASHANTVSTKVSQTENYRAHSERSHEEPGLQTSNTEQEFCDVLAELNATESGDGSTERLIGASSSRDIEGDENSENPKTEYVTANGEETGSSPIAKAAAAKVLTVLGLADSDELQANTANHDAMIESKVKALLEKKATRSDQHKLSAKESITLTNAALKSPNSEASTRKFDEITDSDAVIEARPAANAPNEADKSTKVDTSVLRLNLLSTAKQMVDMYKLALESDGFTGPEGEATRNFLAELGSELKLNTGGNQDAVDPNDELISKESDHLEAKHISTDLLQDNVFEEREELKKWKSEAEVTLKNQSKDLDQLISQNSSLRTNLNLLKDELDTCKAHSKDQIDRLEAKILSTNFLQDSVFEEREELKKWKSEAEVTLKNQSKDLDQLISQNSTLLDLCNEKEEFIKDLSQWKIDAEHTIETQASKLSELSSQASHLLEVCGEQQTSIKVLTQYKSDAEKTMETQSADMKELLSNNDSLSSRCKDQHDVIEELTNWKTDAQLRLKHNDGELSTLRSDNNILLKKSSEQQNTIKKYQEDIKNLRHKLEVESFIVTRFEEDFLEHSKNMMQLNEAIKSKTSEIEILRAKIDELTAENSLMAEKVKDAPNREHQENEKITMKMNHHKELSYLKTQKMSLASRVDELLAEQEEFQSQIEALSGNAALLENELKSEREKHKETKLAVEGMEKALRAVEKKRKKLEAKIKCPK